MRVRILFQTEPISFVIRPPDQLRPKPKAQSLCTQLSEVSGDNTVPPIQHCLFLNSESSTPGPIRTADRIISRALNDRARTHACCMEIRRRAWGRRRNGNAMQQLPNPCRRPGHHAEWRQLYAHHGDWRRNRNLTLLARPFLIPRMCVHRGRVEKLHRHSERDAPFRYLKRSGWMDRDRPARRVA